MSKKELIDILTKKPKVETKPVPIIEEPKKEIINNNNQIIKKKSYSNKKTYNKPLTPPTKKKDVMILKPNLSMDKLIEKKLKLGLELSIDELNYINDIQPDTEYETTDEETENLLLNDLLIKLENGEEMLNEEYILLEEYFGTNLF